MLQNSSVLPGPETPPEDAARFLVSALVALANTAYGPDHQVLPGKIGKPNFRDLSDLSSLDGVKSDVFAKVRLWLQQEGIVAVAPYKSCGHVRFSVAKTADGELRMLRVPTTKSPYFSGRRIDHPAVLQPCANGVFKVDSLFIELLPFLVETGPLAYVFKDADDVLSKRLKTIDAKKSFPGVPEIKDAPVAWLLGSENAVASALSVFQEVLNLSGLKATGAIARSLYVGPDGTPYVDADQVSWKPGCAKNRRNLLAHYADLKAVIEKVSPEWKRIAWIETRNLRSGKTEFRSKQEAAFVNADEPWEKEPDAAPSGAAPRKHRVKAGTTQSKLTHG